MERSKTRKRPQHAVKAASSAVENAQVRVEPDPVLRPLTRQIWRELIASSTERNYLTTNLGRAAGSWWHVQWQKGCLTAQRQQSMVPVGAALSVSASKGASLGSPRVVCDGESVWANKEPTDAKLRDDLAYVMAKIAKFLNWAKVTVHGTKGFQQRYRRFAIHETDFYSWTAEMARTLRERRVADVDWEGIAEELEDLGKSEERALESHLQVLLAHLLKWAYEPDRRSKSWKRSIGNSRDEVKELLDQNPGLRQKIITLFASAYRKARRDAAAETTLEEDSFPPLAPWSFTQVASEDFWPEV